MNKPNLVKISDGSIIDRVDVCFSMRTLQSDTTIKVDLGGRCYREDKKGTLRRIKDRKELQQIIDAEIAYNKAKEYAEGNQKVT